MEMIKEEVSQLIEEIFDENWETKACGRDKCKRLMFDMQKLFPGELFGDTVTGYMKVCKIREFATLHNLRSYTK